MEIAKMKVQCVASKGISLFKRTLRIGQTMNSDFAPLVVGEIYIVYGIELWGGNLHYLVAGKYQGIQQNPFFEPAELFKLVDRQLSKDWYFEWLGTEEKEDAIWGYKELVFNYPQHHDNLIERDENALKIFFQRKHEMDNFYNINTENTNTN
jgi:hypothetical protein